VSDEPGIIIVSSDLRMSSRSRYPFGGRLRHVQSEGLAVASLDRDAVILEGPNATKREILEKWENASYLYFATHIIRDPEIPYLVLIPVATPERDSSPESNYLDFSDIRSADFSTCGLVVLSGCSSGVPSVATRIIGPSLGDAFLDAGAAVVITTFWDVKDEDARRLMTAYTEELNKSGYSHIEALCAARRRLFTEARHSSESFSWASYAIHSGGFNR
jgi:CHAT domain-containing protein